MCAIRSDEEHENGINATYLVKGFPIYFQDLSTSFYPPETLYRAQEVIGDVPGIEKLAQLLRAVKSEAAEDSDPSTYEIAKKSYKIQTSSSVNRITRNLRQNQLKTLLKSLKEEEELLICVTK